jgi:ribosomal protein L11 methyltransferase
MREVVLRVPRIAVEEVLDRLLPIVPGGVRQAPKGRHVELRMRGLVLPDGAEIERAAGRWPHLLSEREVADDWRRRRVDDYEQDTIGGLLVVRPEWAPEPRGDLLDIVLSESSAFGGGTHPTTRTCLEKLLGIEPAGAFADLGCGTGVLAILAARLGWSPVIAVDVQPGSVEATRQNAEANAAEVDSRVLDLTEQPPPRADGLAANIPAWLHASVAASIPEPVPGVALLSGIAPGETADVVAAYAARGLREIDRVDSHGWVVLVLRRD